MREWMYLAALVSTVFCTAVNLYTWRVAYPLWRFAGSSFGAVHAEYMRRLDPVITVPHVAMFFASLGLLVWRPAWVPSRVAAIVFGLNLLVILVSIGVAGPVHGRFTRTEVADEPGMKRLIEVSALRSVLMVGSSALLVWSLAGRLR